MSRVVECGSPLIADADKPWELFVEVPLWILSVRCSRPSVRQGTEVGTGSSQDNGGSSKDVRRRRGSRPRRKFFGFWAIEQPGKELARERPRGCVSSR